MNPLVITTPNEQNFVEQAKQFCDKFLGETDRPKYILGRNVYAQNILNAVAIDAFVDDFSADKTYLGRPVIKTDAVPLNALLLIASAGKPLSARDKIKRLGIECLDYFAFFKFSNLPLTDIIFNEGFEQDFVENAAQYTWIDNLVHDDDSRQIFRQLLSFRLKYNLDLLAGFSCREDQQYFEDFLQLKPAHETFVDIGAVDGLTSHEFIKRCPHYQAIHIFEPEPSNFDVCVNKLSGLGNIKFHQLGLSNKKATLKFAVNASGSKVVTDGAMTINVERLDDVITQPVTFIKIDIEGDESAALAGATESIFKYHPRLAIAIYHQAGDFWKIPQQVLAILSDYHLYLRHYTESIDETVMFFVPV